MAEAIKRVPTRYRRARANTQDAKTMAESIKSANERPKLKLATDDFATASNGAAAPPQSSTSGSDYMTPGAWSLTSSTAAPNGVSTSQFYNQSNHSNFSNFSVASSRDRDDSTGVVSPAERWRKASASTTASPLVSGGGRFDKATPKEDPAADFFDFEEPQQPSASTSASYRSSGGSRTSRTDHETRSSSPQSLGQPERSKSIRSVRSTRSLRRRRSTKSLKDDHDRQSANDVPPPTPVVPSEVADNVVTFNVRLPTQKVIKTTRENVTLADFLQELVQEHRYELTHQDNVDEYMLWEVCEKHKARRPIRPLEFVKFVWQSWEVNSKNYLEVGSSSRRVDLSSIASLVPRRDLMNKATGTLFKGKLYYWRNLHDWRKCWIEISNGSLVLRKREDSREVRSLTLNEFELYENAAKKISGQPAKYVIIIRSQQSPDFFIDKSDAIHYFATDSQSQYDLLRNVINTLRTTQVTKICTAHQENLDGTATQEQSNLISAVMDQPNKDNSEDLPLARLNLADHARRNASAALAGGSSSSSPTIPAGLGLINQIPRTDNEIKQDGLLGSGYSKRAAQAKVSHQQATAAANNAGGAVFSPNSLLSKPTPLSNAATSTKMFEGRGLMGQQVLQQSQMGKKPLPQHSMAVQHQLNR